MSRQERARQGQAASCSGSEALAFAGWCGSAPMSCVGTAPHRNSHGRRHLTEQTHASPIASAGTAPFQSRGHRHAGPCRQQNWKTPSQSQGKVGNYRPLWSAHSCPPLPLARGHRISLPGLSPWPQPLSGLTCSPGISNAHHLTRQVRRPSHTLPCLCLST